MFATIKNVHTILTRIEFIYNVRNDTVGPLPTLGLDNGSLLFSLRGLFVTQLLIQ